MALCGVVRYLGDATITAQEVNMIALANMPSVSDGRLARCVPRRDGGGTIVWDVDAAFDVESDEDAEVVNEFVPGTVAAWASNGIDGCKGVVKTSGGFDIVRVSFDLDGERLASGHAEIRSCGVTVHNSSALVVKMRIHGLMPAAASALVYALDEIVTVSVESRQIQLFSSDESVPNSNESQESLVGKLISVNGAHGIVVSEEHNILTISKVNGVETVDRPKNIGAILEVAAPDGKTLDQVLLEYKQAAKRAGAVPSWADIIEAVGLLYAEGEIQARPDFAWVISDLVTDRAVSLAMVSNGPAEA